MPAQLSWLGAGLLICSGPRPRPLCCTGTARSGQWLSELRSPSSHPCQSRGSQFCPPAYSPSLERVCSRTAASWVQSRGCLSLSCWLWLQRKDPPPAPFPLLVWPSHLCSLQSGAGTRWRTGTRLTQPCALQHPSSRSSSCSAGRRSLYHPSPLLGGPGAPCPAVTSCSRLDSGHPRVALGAKGSLEAAAGPSAALRPFPPRSRWVICVPSLGPVQAAGSPVGPRQSCWTGVNPH